MRALLSFEKNDNLPRGSLILSVELCEYSVIRDFTI